MIHLLALASFWTRDILHPLGGLGYQFWSGIEGAVDRVLTVVVLVALYLRHHNCAAPWCLRRGKHPTADGHHKLCRKHYPDLPDGRLSLAEIHERHEAAK